MNAPVDDNAQEEVLVMAALAREAARDLLFLFNLRQAAERAEPSDGEAIAFMRRAVTYLVSCGAKVGWGDPDASDWRNASEFAGAPDAVATAVVDAWQSDRGKYDFLVFAFRGATHAA